MVDHICPWWIAYTFDNPFRRIFHNPEKMLGSYVSKGMTVLDVGCGMGFFSIGLARLVGDTGCVIAADVQSKMLGVMQRRSEKAGVAMSRSPIEFVFIILYFSPDVTTKISPSSLGR